jgi:predicted enzyme related to lactoylglutathione lyase
MAIARTPHTVLDCPDPLALATFYGTLLDWPVADDGDWADIKDTATGAVVDFQQVADFRPPVWPTQEHPQQFHLDLTVDDLDSAEAEALKLGATKHETQPGGGFRVYLDPAGHPFCLCLP